jgi:hypothetical protein
MIVFLVGSMFFGMQVFNYGVAQADTVRTPEGIYYKGTPDNNTSIRNNQQFDNTQRNIRETARNTQDSFSRNVGETVRTPEGTYYKGTPDRNYSNNNDKNILEKTAENVKEKLNLDEPLPRNTKEFLRSSESKVEKTVKPLTRTPEGYYQTPHR